MTILITGGAGFIGSHVCLELLGQGHDIVVVDDFSNSSAAVVSHMRALADRDFATYSADLRDADALTSIFARHRFHSVIHLAAKKAVAESVERPFEYFDVNVAGTTGLLRAMEAAEVHRLVLSSSCSVYGDGYDRPITEDDLPHPTNPYARSKLICEQVTAEICSVRRDFSVISLRYFNPVGAHPSGKIGECPSGLRTNLMPIIVDVAAGRRDALQVFGGDYPTPDGTAVRDYIHVMDVAEAHRVAVSHLDDAPGMRVLNLGTGVGVSVLDLVRTFAEACSVRIPYNLVGRRAGDVAYLVADPSRADKEWGYRTSREVWEMCRDAWRFDRLNPDGYQGRRR